MTKHVLKSLAGAFAGVALYNVVAVLLFGREFAPLQSTIIALVVGGVMVAMNLVWLRDEADSDREVRDDD